MGQILKFFSKTRFSLNKSEQELQTMTSLLIEFVLLTCATDILDLPEYVLAEQKCLQLQNPTDTEKSL